MIAGRAGATTATGVAHGLGIEPAPCAVEEFPDGELRPRVGSMIGDDVYVVAPTGPPTSSAVVELLLLLDACRRSGAARVSAVVPYFAYARQDRRGSAGEALGARVIADVLEAAGAQRVLVVDPHTTALEAMFSVPVETVTAVPTLLDAVAGDLATQSVVVAPDLGAAKLAQRVGSRLSIGVAVVRKTRTSGRTVEATEVVGDVADRAVLLVDDMVSTGATLETATRVVLAHGARPDVSVLATHGLFVGDALARLDALPLRRVVVADTVPVTVDRSWISVRSIAPVLAEAISRLHGAVRT
ncbi:ribose-phosphate pyrophosphokinase [Actinomycetospora lutea]|uniref:ribose-phosphate diphosphokinase n=1 Tax=Actinomycetospora lutea TaxID=663604 RepID=UPI0023652D5F|nr:ribose-phosphate pyrophosphokinase [Actinomycetospora lutea]MDD7942437.1 ribose-phosphate pyrophosphokinase [Actinomycetospora lutea]